MVIVTIECFADYCRVYCGIRAEKVKIEKRSSEIYVNNRKAIEIKYNGIQLRFEMEKTGIEKAGDLYIIFDGRSKSDMTIKQMYEKLKD